MSDINVNNENAKQDIRRAEAKIQEAMGWLNDAAQKVPGISSSLHQATYDLDKVISRVQDDANRIG